MSRSKQDAARYHFGDAAPVGLLLGMPARQTAPIVIGVLWLLIDRLLLVPLERSTIERWGMVRRA